MTDDSCGTFTHVHDVLIIGAGPAGLAVAARLNENTPSAIYTDEEHRRYQWLRQRAGRVPVRRSRDGAILRPAAEVAAGAGRGPSRQGMNGDEEEGEEGLVPPSASSKHGLLVLDAEGPDWMSRWNRLFKAFDITFLRSPMFFHVDPSDRDSLLAFAYGTGRDAKELQVVHGCIGKEVSKHRKKKKHRNTIQCQPRVIINERERMDYFNPTRELFRDHCETVARRYGIDKPSGIVQHERTTLLDYGVVPAVDPDEPVFTVETDKQTHYARVVVMAVGPANEPTIPGLMPGEKLNHDAACHTMDIKHIPAPHVAARVAARKETNVVIVGGGLVSAQIADLAIRNGVTRVWHLMRGPLKVKPFDIDLSWLSKFRNLEHAAFWSAETDEDRLELILKARNGGSLTGRFHKIEQAHIKAGRINLHQHTTIVSRVWDPVDMKWSIETEPPVPNLPKMDYIYFATGIQTNVRNIDFLQPIFEKYPIPDAGGFPCLTDDLQWNEEVPLFATGRLAALRLGPGAHNLVGARAGAERVAWAVEERLSELEHGSAKAAAAVLNSQPLAEPSSHTRNPKIVKTTQFLRSKGESAASAAKEKNVESKLKRGLKKTRRLDSQGSGTLSASDLDLDTDERGSVSSCSCDHDRSSVYSGADSGEFGSTEDETVSVPQRRHRSQQVRFFIGEGSRFEALRDLEDC